MLGHQLPQLPPWSVFWNELEDLFAWLEGAAAPPILAPMATVGPPATGWAPPPTMRTWGGSPVELLRFAAESRGFASSFPLLFEPLEHGRLASAIRRAIARASSDFSTLLERTREPRHPKNLPSQSLKIGVTIESQLGGEMLDRQTAPVDRMFAHCV